MKCPHCGQEHPDNHLFCPITGKKIQLDSPALLACTHEGCPIYGQHILPADSRFCPECGTKIKQPQSVVVTETISDQSDKIQISVVSSEGCILYKHNALVGNDDMIVTSDALFICSNPESSDYMDEKWIRVDTLGQTTEVRYDDIPENDEIIDNYYSWTSSRRNQLFLKRNPSIKETVYIGKIKGKSVFIALTCSQRYSTIEPGYVDISPVRESIPGAKVYDEDFNLLRTVGERYVPKWAFNSGYFSILDTETGKYGLCDMNQDVIIPCQYENSIDGKYDDIFEVPECDEHGWVRCFYAVTKKWYLSSYDRYLLNQVSEDIVELINPKTSHVMCELEEGYVTRWGGHVTTKEIDGFSELLYLKSNLLCNGDKVIKLDNSEEYEELCYTRSESSPYYEQEDDYLDLFIGEGRIITYAQAWESPQDLLFTRIRDYSGEIIKEFDPSITFKRPFKNGKAVFVKTFSDCRKIGYVDMEGGMHYCQLSLPLENRYHDEIKLSDVDCEVVSDDTIWVMNDYDYYLIKTDGTVLMDDNYQIEVIGFNLLKVSYFNGFNSKEMICDGHGNTLFYSQSSNWDVKLIKNHQ